jgi:hypothetical protein
MLPLTEHEALIAKMVALYPRTYGPECADKYRAKAEWWRLHAEETMNPAECLQYALNQDAIADDMEGRPGHHKYKPESVTRYQWTLQ